MLNLVAFREFISLFCFIQQFLLNLELQCKYVSCSFKLNRRAVFCGIGPFSKWLYIFGCSRGVVVTHFTAALNQRVRFPRATIPSGWIQSTLNDHVTQLSFSGPGCSRAKKCWRGPVPFVPTVIGDGPPTECQPCRSDSKGMWLTLWYAASLVPPFHPPWTYYANHCWLLAGGTSA
jgi:hypothetical protein